MVEKVLLQNCNINWTNLRFPTYWQKRDIWKKFKSKSSNKCV